jgi:hypothetical protein
MARTIVYRVKTPAGAWQRAVIDDTALPQNITGLVAGETYQVDTGKGTLVDVTPLNTFTLETFTGTPVVTGPGEYELTVTAPAYLAAYNPGGGAGVYTWNTTELATGPKVLYPGSVNDTAYSAGEVITIVNSAFGVGSGAVDVFYRVYDDGVEVFDGATLNFDTTGLAGSSVSVRSYMVDQNGESAEATILTVTIAAAADPTTLFSVGRDGFSVVPGLTTSFESADDSDAAEVNDLVQFQKDSSGLASPRNLSQATSGTRPTLLLTSGTYSLDFSSHRLSTASYTSVSNTNGYSVFARIWVDTTDPTFPRTIIGSDSSSNPNRIVYFRVANSPQGAISFTGWDASNNAVTATTSTTLATGAWYNVCGVWNATNARVWITDMDDADVAATATNTVGTIQTASQAVHIGARWTSTENFFDGKIAYAFIGNWSLSEADRNLLATFANTL